ncbi:MAG: D-hexose-6-phosphate mutarotase [Candidatus Competibacteraceae bacterium]
MNPATPTPVFAIAPGTGDLTKLTLTAPDGARAEIYLHGAHVTSWIPAGGQERLFLSQASQFSAGTPICGGIPVVFPQFGMFGPLPRHGLARLMPWEFASAEVVGGRASATFRLHDTEDSRQRWANAFLSELTVAISGNQLAVTLAVTNFGAEPFAFTTALHTYLAVTSLAATCVGELTGLRYCDAAAGWTEDHQVIPHLNFTGEVNRIYFDAPAEIRLIEPTQTICIQSTGFPDVVVWNPAADKCAAMPDLQPEDYQRFVCIEAAVIGAPVNLAPGECWQGAQRLLAMSTEQ